MASFTRWCYRHRKFVLFLWLGLFVGLGAIAQVRGSVYSANFDLPGTDSVRALEILQERAPSSAGDTADVVFAALDGTTLQDPDNRAQVEDALAALAADPIVAQVTDPYGPPQPTISEDGRIGLSTLTFDGLVQDLDVADVRGVVDTAKSYETDTLQIELGGPGIQFATQAPPPATELLALGIAAIVLFFTFGSIVASLMPLLVAVIALGTGLSVVGLLTNVIDVPDFAPVLASLIGLGVGIDYALFVVTRFRSGLHAGKSVEDSIVEAGDTSGRAVVFAGTIVVVSLMGMFLLRVSFLYGVALTSAIVVTSTMIAAITLLPAVLGMLGPRIDRWRLGRAATATDHAGEKGWARWSRWIQRRPVVAALIGGAILIALCIPALDLRLGSSDTGNDRPGATTREAYDLLAAGFGPGYNGPFLLVADFPEGTDPAVLEPLVMMLSDDAEVATVTPIVPLPSGDTAILTVYGKSAPQAVETDELLQRLREDIIPAATANTPVVVYVGGQTAIFADFGAVLTAKLPLFFGVVVLISFLLLMMVFRSLLVPAKAAVMNLLSIGAAFGVVVVIFQWGFGANLLDIKAGPIESFLPVMLFAILFGLSMDYEVFLVSRIHEEWVKTRDNTLAVTHGLAMTGRVITAAAMIMFVVFGSFVLGGERVIQLFGIGLAVAVLIDATVIRSLLVPALMQLFGKANWWLPAWMDKALPNLSIEGSSYDDVDLLEDAEAIATGLASPAAPAE